MTMFGHALAFSGGDGKELTSSLSDDRFDLRGSFPNGGLEGARDAQVHVVCAVDEEEELVSHLSSCADQTDLDGSELSEGNEMLAGGQRPAPRPDWSVSPWDTKVRREKLLGMSASAPRPKSSRKTATTMEPERSSSTMGLSGAARNALSRSAASAARSPFVPTPGYSVDVPPAWFSTRSSDVPFRPLFTRVDAWSKEGTASRISMPKGYVSTRWHATGFTSHDSALCWETKTLIARKNPPIPTIKRIKTARAPGPYLGMLDGVSVMRSP